jgi:hypothetical protein
MLHLRFRFPGRWAEYKERCRREGVQPRAFYMAAIFGEANGWNDIPLVNYLEDGSWWETQNRSDRNPATTR